MLFCTSKNIYLQLCLPLRVVTSFKKNARKDEMVLVFFFWENVKIIVDIIF